MEEKNELNDIILNKSSSSAGNKKIILVVATLGIILIIVVMLMSTLASNGTSNLPQAALPPEPQKQNKPITDEPLFEEVKVVKESNQESSSLDQIAQKLKEESIKESASTVEKVESAEKETPKPVIEKPKKVAAKESPKESETSAAATTSSGYYIQVGSFAKYEPNKKFLDSILKLGYKYKFHQVTIGSKEVNKVLVGPFSSEPEARKALKPIRSSVEAGAFITKI